MSRWLTTVLARVDRWYAARAVARQQAKAAEERRLARDRERWL